MKVQALLIYDVSTVEEYLQVMEDLRRTSANSIDWTADIPPEWEEIRCGEPGRCGEAA